MFGGLNSLFFVIMLTGGRINANLGQAVVQMRKDAFEKWRAFFMFLQTTLVLGYFKWKGIPVPADTTATDNATILGQLREGQKDNLSIWFYTNIIEKGVNMLLEMLKPSAMEDMLMTQLLGNLGGGGRTPNQIRSSGGNTYGN